MPSRPVSTPPRVALIGVSGYGRIYYNLLRELHSSGEIRLTAVAMIDPDKEKPIVRELGTMGCDVFADYQEMLQKHCGRIDLCAIPTGIPWHTRMTLAALETGAHILVEKPLAATLEEVDAIRAAEARHGRLVMVGFQYLYSPENLSLKQAVLDSAIGPLRKVRVIGLWPRGAEYYSRTDWAGRIKTGDVWVLDSPISNAFAHHLSLALFFAGPQMGSSAAPKSVTAELYRAQPIENFDTAVLRIETDTGVRIHFYASHSCQATFDPELVLEGENGRIIWRHGRGYRIESKDAPHRFVPLIDEQAARLGMFRSAIRRLTDPRVFVCDTAIAREHTRCIQAAQVAGAIRDVPKDWIETNGKSGMRRDTWIRGIEETLQRAFGGAQSLAEIGCPWASAPAEISVADADLSSLSTGTPSQQSSPSP